MKLVVLGGGESGVGAALLGRHLGYEVFLSDKGKLAESYRDELITHRIGSTRWIGFLLLNWW